MDQALFYRTKHTEEQDYNYVSDYSPGQPLVFYARQETVKGAGLPWMWPRGRQ